MPTGISDTGIASAEFEQRLTEMVGQALRDSCTPTNPRTPDANALIELYRRAWSAPVIARRRCACAGRQGAECQAGSGVSRPGRNTDTVLTAGLLSAAEQNIWRILHGTLQLNAARPRAG